MVDTLGASKSVPEIFLGFDDFELWLRADEAFGDCDSMTIRELAGILARTTLVRRLIALGALEVDGDIVRKANVTIVEQKKSVIRDFVEVDEIDEDDTAEVSEPEAEDAADQKAGYFGLKRKAFAEAADILDQGERELLEVAINKAANWEGNYPYSRVSLSRFKSFGLEPARVAMVMSMVGIKFESTSTTGGEGVYLIPRFLRGWPWDEESKDE